MGSDATGLDRAREHRDDLEALADRDDLRTAKYARALLDALDDRDTREDPDAAARETRRSGG